MEENNKTTPQEPAQNTTPPPSTNTIPPNSELVDIDLKKKPPEEKTAITFSESFDVAQHVAQKTESEVLNKQTAEANKTVTTDTKRTVASELAKLNEEEKKFSEQFTPEDFEDLAEFIVYGFDILMGWALWRYSLADPKKSSTSEYKVPEERLKRLKTILAKILMKMNLKFPLWTTLLFVAVLTYLPAATKANSIRKENIKKKEEEEANSTTAPASKKPVGPGGPNPPAGPKKITAPTKNGEKVNVTVPPPAQKEFIPERKEVVITTPPPVTEPVKTEEKQVVVTPPPPIKKEYPVPGDKRAPRTGTKSRRGGMHKA